MEKETPENNFIAEYKLNKRGIHVFMNCSKKFMKCLLNQSFLRCPEISVDVLIIQQWLKSRVLIIQQWLKSRVLIIQQWLKSRVLIIQQWLKSRVLIIQQWLKSRVLIIQQWLKSRVFSDLRG